MMAGYRYRGSDFSLDEPIKPEPESICGTYAGFRRHTRNETEPCEPCIEAQREYKRAIYAKNRKPVTPIDRSCGTRGGYRAHRAKGETACDKCRAANNAYNRDHERRKNGRRPQTGFTQNQCGTMAGYSSHRRHNIPICDPCRNACREYNKRRYLEKNAA